LEGGESFVPSDIGSFGMPKGEWKPEARGESPERYQHLNSILLDVPEGERGTTKRGRQCLERFHIKVEKNSKNKGTRSTIANKQPGEKDCQRNKPKGKKSAKTKTKGTPKVSAKKRKNKHWAW